MTCWHCNNELDINYQSNDFTFRFYHCSFCDKWYEFRKEKVRLAHKEGVKHAHIQDLNDHLLPENVLLQRQTIKAMANSVKMLPKTERTVLLLHRLDKLTYTQIAKKTGFSETTIRRKVAKAVERIRKDLIRATGL